MESTAAIATVPAIRPSPVDERTGWVQDMQDAMTQDRLDQAESAREGTEPDAEPAEGQQPRDSPGRSESAPQQPSADTTSSGAGPPPSADDAVPGNRAPPDKP